jgi:hypothetical protein
MEAHVLMNASRLLRIAARVAAQKFRRDLEWWSDCCKDPPPEEAPKYWRKDIPDRIYSEIQKGKRETTIKWINPNPTDESEKIAKIAQSIGLDHQDIMKKAANGFLTELAPEAWAKLEGSDSWRIESMEEAEMLAAMRDEDLQPIMDLIAGGKGVPAPIVLFNFDVNEHLVTGNAQLMIARAMDVPAKAFYVNMAQDKMSDLPDMPVTGYRDEGRGPVKSAWKT